MTAPRAPTPRPGPRTAGTATARRRVATASRARTPTPAQATTRATATPTPARGTTAVTPAAAPSRRRRTTCLRRATGRATARRRCRRVRRRSSPSCGSVSDGDGWRPLARLVEVEHRGHAAERDPVADADRELEDLPVGELGLHVVEERGRRATGGRARTCRRTRSPTAPARSSWTVSGPSMCAYSSSSTPWRGQRMAPAMPCRCCSR